MTQLFRRRFFLFGLLVLLSANSIYCQTKYKLISELSLGEYRILNFVKNQDTLVIVKKDIVSTKKIQNNIEEIVGGKIGTKISQLKVNGKIYWFYYKMDSQKGLIDVGEFSPGTAGKKIYTYRSFPIFVEKFTEK